MVPLSDKTRAVTARPRDIVTTVQASVGTPSTGAPYVMPPLPYFLLCRTMLPSIM